ncbi:MAG: hypothetical protein IRZ31_15395 [Thermogemmatispora sp.]|uniref:hypothetical protein n=1 Tax=Thermogemmatispora sp. TaxID=1968838 RepID=UPI00262075B6|nr:hypothetical protein [Thermogemmatispora sp.]MBX5458277.1 hypothetical protein [Thermogemmatispora sp.]
MQLHHQARRYDELVPALDSKQLFLYDYADDRDTIKRRQREQFRWDLKALRLLGCEIVFDRRHRLYHWQNSPFGLPLDEETVL